MINVDLKRRLENLERSQSATESMAAWVTVGGKRQLWSFPKIARTVFENPWLEISEIEYLSGEITVVQEVARALLLKQL